MIWFSQAILAALSWNEFCLVVHGASFVDGSAAWPCCRRKVSLVGSQRGEALVNLRTSGGFWGDFWPYNLRPFGEDVVFDLF